MESKIPQCIIDYLMPDFREQMEQVHLKKQDLHEKDGCFVKDVNERDIIYKYLPKLDHNFLFTLNRIDDFFGFDEGKYVWSAAHFSNEDS